MTLGVRVLRRREDAGSREKEAGGTSPKTWLLAVCCVAQFMVILDLTIVNVALPSIQSSLNFSAVSLQWVVDAYAIVFAGFLMLGGRATDHFGQRRTFVVALLLFAVASLAGGSAFDRQMLIAARAVQGLSGALMAASSLAIITSSFAVGPERNRAIGLWGAMNGAGGAAGTLLGGVITQELTWRWVLLINPPIGLAAAAVAFRVVENRRRTEPGAPFDLGGALTLTLGLLVLVYGIVGAGVLGWASIDAIGPILIGVALLALFPVIETRVASAPLVPLKALTRPLRVANGIVLLFSAALFPMWYVSSLYLQQVLGLSPLDAGLTFLPMALLIMVSSSRASKLVTRLGVRAVLSGGLVMMACGMLLLARIGTSGSAIWYVMLPGLLTSAGIGLSVVPSTIAATQGAGPGQAGLASGLVNTSRQVGGALGIALLISVATQYTSGLIGTGHGVSQALTDGFRIAYLIGAGLAGLAAVVTLALIPKPEVSITQLLGRLRVPVGVAVVVGAFTALNVGTAGWGGAPIGAYTTEGAYRFVSAPGLHPPQVRSDHPIANAELAPGYVMVANFYDLTSHPMVGQSGPLIMDDKLQPVWFKPVPTDMVAANLSVQTYKGKPVLAWWQGVITATGATQSGEDIVVNQHYQTVATLKGADGWIITLHSLSIRGDDAWVTANKNIPMDLSKYGGSKNGAVVDSAVQEYSLRTGKLLRSWDALDHVPLSDSYATPPTNGFPWDAYHVNSISFTGTDTLLVSMRNTWAAYQVDRKSGKIEWVLGGKDSSFRFGSGAAFEWQHDVVMHSGSMVSLFDDHCCQITGAGTYLSPTEPSRGVVLKLNQSGRTATLVAQYSHRQGLSAAYMGNTQLLPDGNVFIGWGAQPYFSEYSKSGKTLLDAVFPGPDLSYRANLESWVGLPLYPPSGAARSTNGTTTVYASWNGATEVTTWRVLAGPSARRLSAVAAKTKSGFETAIPVGGGAKVFRVEALNADGRVIGTSGLFRASR